MATRTIANGGGAWGTNSTWVEGVAPTSSDDVVATATSGNLTGAGSCRSIDLTGYTGIWTMGSVNSLQVGLTTSTRPPNGNALVFPSSGWTFSPGTSTITFGSTYSGTLNIDTGGKTMPNGVSIVTPSTTTVYALTNNFKAGSGSTFTISNNGTFNANGYNFTAGAFVASAGTRSILMGSGTWTLGGSVSTVWNTGSGTGLTFDAGTANVIFNVSGSRTLNGNVTFYNMTLSVTTARVVTITDTRTIGASNSLTLNGASGQLLTLQGSSTGGWTLAVPSTQSINYVSVSRSTATGNTAVATNSTDGGNNVNWTITPPVPVNTVAPAVTPSPATVGQACSCTTGTWTGSPTSYSYQWKLDGSNVGTDSSSYTPVAAGTLTCTVTASNAGGAGTPAVSNSVTVSAAASGVAPTGNPGLKSGLAGIRSQLGGL